MAHHHTIATFAVLAAIMRQGHAKSAAPPGATLVLNPEEVRRANSDPARTFVSEMSPRFLDTTVDEARALLSPVPPHTATELAVGGMRLNTRQGQAPPPPGKKYPAAFDARANWTQCSTVATIQNQGGCGSCWAFGTSEAFSDRVCIASNGTIDAIFSAQEATSCTGCMGPKPGQFTPTCNYTGCGGGQPTEAWRFFEEQGLVSAACWPYGLKPAGPKLTCNASRMNNHSCVDGAKWAPTFAKINSTIALNKVDAIKEELMANGPVSTAFKVYEDFFQYKSGVYNGCSPPANQSRKIAGYHAVKIVGWGSTDIDPVLDYWTVQNSWGPAWGMGGYFNMVMDFTDQFNVSHSSCGIGTQVSAGLIDLSRHTPAAPPHATALQSV